MYKIIKMINEIKKKRCLSRIRQNLQALGMPEVNDMTDAELEKAIIDLSVNISKVGISVDEAQKALSKIAII